MELARFNLDTGGSVLVEVADSPGVERVGRQGEVLEAVGVSFERAIANVRDAATAALAQFQEMTRKPDDVEIKFGVKLDAKMGAVIAQTGLQGQLEVKLTWHSAG